MKLTFPSKLPAASLLLVALVALTLSGCRRTPEDPGGYSRERPPPDRIDSRDSDLQSYDVIAAADQMTTSLLTLPEVQQVQPEERLKVVVDRVANMTVTQQQSLDIFLEQLRIELARRGRDKILLITDRAVLRDIQSRELEQPAGPPGEPGPAGTQPDYALHAQASDLPNRGTNFYQFVFTLTDLKTREDVWTDAYIVRTAR